MGVGVGLYLCVILSSLLSRFRARARSLSRTYTHTCKPNLILILHFTFHCILTTRVTVASGNDDGFRYDKYKLFDVKCDNSYPDGSWYVGAPRGALYAGGMGGRGCSTWVGALLCVFLRVR